MKLTKVELKVPKGKVSKVLCYADLTFDDCMIIYDCKLIQGSNGAFVSYPSRKGKDDKYWDHVRVQKDFGNEISLAVYQKYLNVGSSSKDDLPF